MKNISNNKSITYPNIHLLPKRLFDAVTPAWVPCAYKGIKNYTRGWQGAARLAILGASVALNVLTRYYIINQFFKARSGLNETLNKETVNASDFDKNFFDILYWAGTWIAAEIASWLCSDLFIYSFQVDMKKQLYERLIESGAYNGRYYLEHDNDNKQVDPTYVITRDTGVYVESTANLIVRFSGATAAFVLGVSNLSALLAPSVVIGSIAAVFVMKLITYVACKYIRTVTQECNKVYEEETESLQSLNKFSESIILNKGCDFELKEFMQYLKKGLHYNRVTAAWNSLLSFVNSWKGFGSFAYGIYLFRDKLISKEMNWADAFQVGASLEYLINYITWNDTNNSTYIRQETAFERIERLEKTIDQWNVAIENRNKHFKIQHTSKNEVFFHGVVKKPNGEVLFKAENLKLESGKIYRLTGKSGAGKSTVLRALAGIWPYAQGAVNMPKKVRFVPQTTFIKSGNALLIDIIRYPKTQKLSKKEETRIKTLMKTFGLGHLVPYLQKQQWKNKKNITETAQWYKTLSGGEKQRIALISAILDKPKFLVLDEATSAIDKDWKSIVESTMKKELAESIILFVDHNPSKEFADKEILVENGFVV